MKNLKTVIFMGLILLTMVSAETLIWSGDLGLFALILLIVATLGVGNEVFEDIYVYDGEEEEESE